jgi:hypothetical protein
MSYMNMFSDNNDTIYRPLLALYNVRQREDQSSNNPLLPCRPVNEKHGYQLSNYLILRNRKIHHASDECF